MAQLQLTFDDGPQSVATALNSILAELAQRNKKGAFFVLGQEVHADPQATRNIVNAGHTMGNHSWDHLEPSTANYTDAQIREQFDHTHNEATSVIIPAVLRHWRTTSSANSAPHHHSHTRSQPALHIVSLRRPCGQRRFTGRHHRCGDAASHSLRYRCAT
jgi:peptidoglycan/xylan/chitin deacetylase (PgdA/CDA1 family)